MFEAVRMSELGGGSSDGQSFMVAQETKEDAQHKQVAWNFLCTVRFICMANRETWRSELHSASAPRAVVGRVRYKTSQRYPAANSAKQLCSFYIAYHDSLDAFLLCL
jgi:hypothetical protein